MYLLLFSICVYRFIHLVSGCSTNSLESPPAVRHDAVRPEDIEWETVAGEVNTWQYTMFFDVSQQDFPEIDTRFQTRLFNDHFPSQTLRFRRGNQYRITVVNQLGPESPLNPTSGNVQKDLNTTNIHLHGLHISGMVQFASLYVCTF